MGEVVTSNTIVVFKNSIIQQEVGEIYTGKGSQSLVFSQHFFLFTVTVEEAPVMIPEFYLTYTEENIWTFKYLVNIL